MQTLSHELKSVIGRRLAAASSREVLAIASALCIEEAPAAAPTDGEAVTARFHLLDAEQAVDTTTGLIWTRRNVAKKRLEWQDAKTACEELLLGGHAWRMPTIRELLSLVDYDRHEPAIDTDVFECESSWYWTSTPAASSPVVCAWLVNFYGGYAFWSNHGDGGFVRAVRAGQS